MARVGADGGKYPPTEFSTKYAAVLAPKGKLVSPKDVFGEEGCFDKGRWTDNPPVTFTSSWQRPNLAFIHLFPNTGSILDLKYCKSVLFGDMGCLLTT